MKNFLTRAKFFKSKILEIRKSGELSAVDVRINHSLKNDSQNFRICLFESVASIFYETFFFPSRYHDRADFRERESLERYCRSGYEAIMRDRDIIISGECVSYITTNHIILQVEAKGHVITVGRLRT